METKTPETKLTRLQTVIRCSPALILLLLGFSLLTFIQTTENSISGYPTRDYRWIIGITELTIYIWVRAFSRVPLRAQVLTLVFICGLQLSLYSVLYTDGFMGDGRPILAWRWNPSTNELWQEQKLNDNSKKITAPIDLSTSNKFDSPAFRGTDRTGRMPSVSLARKWIQPPEKLWSHPVGLGWSSFAVVGDYCMTQEQRGDDECIVCYELRTGKEVWKHSDVAYFNEVTGGMGPRATPSVQNGRVFALGATGILNCLDGSNGQRIWSINILKDNDAENALFGMSGSPLLVNGLVIVSPGGKAGSLVAYDQRSGDRVWANGESNTSYSSPQYADFATGPQVLIFNAEGIYGHDVTSGTLLWNYPWVSNPSERNNVCQPVALPGDEETPDRVFISSGYGMGCALFDLIPSGKTFEVRKRWANRNLKAKFSSVVRRGTHVYGLDGSILVCIDLATGERCWKGGRYGYGQLVLVDDMLLVQAESGEVVLVEATPDRHHALARFAALNHRTWNSPVVSGSLLLVRNDREAACYQLPLAR